MKSDANPSHGQVQHLQDVMIEPLNIKKNEQELYTEHL